VLLQTLEASGSHASDVSCACLHRLPHVGQNLWFYLDSADDIRSLCENLHPRGVRESVLKDELRKNLDNIMKSIYGVSSRYVMSSKGLSKKE